MSRSVVRSWLLNLIPCAAVAAPDRTFEPQCADAGDFGWERFESRESLLASSWATYFLDVYGELPPAFPVCTFDFWHIEKAAFDTAAISGHAPVATRAQHASWSPVVPPSPWDWEAGMFFERVMTGWIESSDWYKGFGIYHASNPLRLLENRSWIEVRHRAVESEELGMWLTYARGSGVWFNIGEAVMFPSHVAATRALCDDPTAQGDLVDCARSRTDLHTVLFDAWQQDTAGSWGLANMFELVAVRLSGQYACGTAEPEEAASFRAGWQASRPCPCSNSCEGPGNCWLNCGLSNLTTRPTTTWATTATGTTTSAPYVPCSGHCCDDASWSADSSGQWTCRALVETGRLLQDRCNTSSDVASHCRRSCNLCHGISV